MARKITLEAWARQEFDPPPAERTLRRWVSEGKIVPPPIPVDRTLYIEPTASVLVLGLPWKWVDAHIAARRLTEQERAKRAAAADAVLRERNARSNRSWHATRARLSAQRRAALLQRTPLWADHDAIAAVYAEAARLSAATGIAHHVDHRYPLQGRLVSGLHVAANLQVLPAVENHRKHNRYEVE